MKIILLRSGLLIALTFIGVGDAFSSDMKACPDSPKSEQQGDFVSNDSHNCMGFLNTAGRFISGFSKMAIIMELAQFFTQQETNTRANSNLVNLSVEAFLLTLMEM